MGRWDKEWVRRHGSWGQTNRILNLSFVIYQQCDLEQMT